MNLVGKIFTVAIFVMSLMFMAFAVAVYATHKNWKEVVTNTQAAPGRPLGLKPQLDRAKKYNEDLKEQKARLLDELAKERKAREQVLGKAESEKRDLERQIKSLTDEQLRLLKVEAEAAAAMNAAQRSLEKLRAEIGGPDGKSGLRGDIVKAQQEKDAYFKEVLRLTDELHNAVNELGRLRDRQKELAAELAKAMEVLRLFDLKPEPTLYAGIAPDVRGLVTAVRGDGLLEINIGADDGLLKKHRLEVYRVRGSQTAYVGRIEVVEVFPDQAVCRIDPKYLKSPMQVGDHVAGRLQ